MTPARTGGKTGNYELQEIFRNVGEIRQSLGTSDLTEFNNRRALLRKIEKREKWDILRAFRDRKITIEELIEADANDRLGATLADARLGMNLWDQVESALGKIKAKKTTVDRYQSAFKALQLKAAKELPDNAIVADLADVKWIDLGDAWGNSGADWMHMKRAVSRVVGVIVGNKYHPFLTQLRQDIPNRKVKKRQPRIRPADFVKIVSKAPEHAAASFWCLVVTGLRDRSEYLRCRPEHLDHRECSISIPGTKTEESEAPLKVAPRLWHFVVAAVPSRLQYGWLHRYWQRACVEAGFARYVPSTRFPSGQMYVGPTLHDLRHAYGQWAIDRGVAESSVEGSYRHTNSQQTREYVRYNATLEVSEAIADALEPFIKPKTRKPRKRA